MQFTTTMLAAVLASVAIAHSGFKVPEGTPDGIYMVGHDENGQELHKRVDTAFSSKFAARNAAPASGLEARGFDIELGCNNYALNPADTDKANQMLDAQCAASEVKGYKNFYSVSGNVVAYFCNNVSWNLSCTGRAEASKAITAKCGAYRAGWQHQDSDFWGLQENDFYYGYADKTNKFCGEGM